MTTVFQEQAMLLYAIAGLMLLLNVVAIGVWLRLGDIRSALKWAPRDDAPKMSGVRVPDRTDSASWYLRQQKPPSP